MGASTVKDIVDTLTSNTGALSDNGSSNSFSSGASGLSLRNLGKGSTLTLLNGRRVSNFGTADGGQQTFVNIDSIPSEVIERVDVLLDGASAIYGSDAVAGVVNIITKKEFSGLTLRAGARQSLKKSDLERDQTASVTWGLGDFNSDGWNVFNHLELFHRNPYDQRAIRNIVPKWYIDYVSPTMGVKSTYSIPGNYFGRYPANYPDKNLAGKSIAVAAPGCAPELLEDGLCKFDQWARAFAMPEADRANFISSGRLKINENLQAFAEVTLSDTKTSFYNPPATLAYTGTPVSWYNTKLGKLESIVEPMLPAGHPYNPYSFPIQLRYRFADNLDMYRSEAHARQHRVMVGLEGTHFGWDWNGAIGTMGNSSDAVSRGGRHAKNWVNAIVSGEYKFNQKNSDELLLRMFPYISFDGKSTQHFIDLRASRELMQLPGGPMALAVGVDYRRDKFESWTSDNVANAEIISYGSIDVNGGRNMYAAYAELAAPVIKDLELSAAVRADKVGEADLNFVPKFSVRYQLHPTLMTRATVSQGFRAPNAAETGDVTLSAFQNGLQDPKRCAIATQLYNELRKGNAVDQADAIRARDSGCSASAAVSAAGNKDLDAEKSKSVTAGVVWQPTKDLSMSLDYYRIERRNEIGTRDIDQILSREDQDPSLVQRLAVTDDDRRLSDRAFELSGKRISHTTGPLSAIYQRYENLDRTRVEGLDIEVNHRINLGSWGKISNTLRSNYQLDYRGWDTFENTYTENLVGNYGNERFNARASTLWTMGPMRTGLTVTYIPGTKLINDKYDQRYTAEGCAARNYPVEYCKIKKDVLVDAYFGYDVLKNTSVSVNIDNLLDRANNVNVRGGIPLRGRVMRVAVEHKF